MVKFFKPLMLSALAVTFFGGICVHSAEYPKAGAACATLTTQGCWTWYHDSRAVYYKGTHEKTYVGYFHSDNNPGEAAIASYDHTTGTVQTFNLKTNFGFDDHNTVTVHVLPNGHIITFYCVHYGAAWYSRISTNPEDISAWGAEKTVNVACTYPNVCQLSAENNRLYLFFRGPSTQGGDAGMPYYQTSDDGGVTWSAATKYFFAGTETAGMRPYCKYVSNGKDKIYMLIERDNRNNAPPKATYFMYYYNGGFYKMDGTLIKTVADVQAAPITVNDVDMVFDPANPPDGLSNVIGTGWDVALDPAGNPVFVYDIYDNANGGPNHRYYYYRWDGTKWNSHFLINSGGPMTEGNVEVGFGGGLILDHSNPNLVYLSTHVNGVFELQRWLTADNGSSWTIWQITSGSAAKNCRPIVPRNTPGGKIDVVWNYGTYTTWGGPFSMDVKMYTFDSTKIASGVTPVKSWFERRAPKETGFNLLVSGLSFTLASPSSSTLRIYNIEGRMVSDLTSSVRRMQAGVNAVQYKLVGLTRGMYIARLFDGAQNYSQSFVVQR
jgi:BNR repeat-containing family member